MNRRDWWIWRLHIIRYAMVQKRFWGIQFFAPERHAYGLKRCLEIFTGAHLFVFYWEKLD